MARQGKKQAVRLAARVKGYDQVVSADANRKTQFTKPGSNKKH